MSLEYPMGSEIRNRTAFILILLSVCHCHSFARPVAEIPRWLNERLAEAGITEQHKRIVGIAVATGRFSKDPILANELRQVAHVAATAVLGTNDTLAIYGFELQPRECMPFRQISDLPDLESVLTRLPYTPAEGTIGGTDIEATLANLNELREGAIWIAISPGASQASRQSGELLGEQSLKATLNRLKVRGPYRQEFASASGNNVLISLTIPSPSSFSESQRTPFPPIVEDSALLTSPVTQSPSASETGPSMLQLLGIPLMALILGVVGGRLLMRPNVKDVQTRNSESPEVPPNTTDLNKLARKIDLSAQELAEEVERLSIERQELTTAHDALSELRETRQEMELKWSAWETAAIEFLDSAQRALQLPELTQERKETWKRAADDFGRRIRSLGFEIINPEPGSPIEDGPYSVQSVSGKPEVVAEVLSWGYRNGARIIRPAVIAASSKLEFANE